MFSFPFYPSLFYKFRSFQVRFIIDFNKNFSFFAFTFYNSQKNIQNTQSFSFLKFYSFLFNFFEAGRKVSKQSQNTDKIVYQGAFSIFIFLYGLGC